VVIVEFSLMGLSALPAFRNMTYFAAERVWRSHWLHGPGKGLPIGAARLLRPSVPVWVEVEPHMTMLLDPMDFVQRHIIETGVWEPETWRCVAEHIGSGGVLVDVGSHVGYYALKAAQVVGPGGHVLAIEPNPDTLQVLRANVEANGGSMIEVDPVACSDSEGRVELFAAGRANTGASSMSSTNAARGGAGKSFWVRTRPLDALVQESRVTRVDAIKIDVEGAEFLVLKGAQQTLDRYHPVVTVEMDEDTLNNMGTSCAQVTQLFRAHGYTPRHSFATENNNTEFAFTPGLSTTSK
jgi:FkbM family methyltransferase